MKPFMNKKIIIISIVIVLVLLLILLVVSLESSKKQTEPKQNKTVDSASGLEVLAPDGKTPELGGGLSTLIIGAQKLYDAGTPKTIVEPVLSQLDAYGLKLSPKASKISIYKDSVRQVFAQNSPMTSLVFDILVSDKDKLSVSANYSSIDFIDTLVIKNNSGEVLYNYTISGD